MIVITDSDGCKHYIHRNNIARITEASSSSQWHGIRSIVRLFDNGLIEAQESAVQIASRIDAERDDATED